MNPALRILDANLNRAREAMRVMEEAARFALDDRRWAAAAKQLRHDLAAAGAALPAVELNRDTPGDVGTALTTQRETQRTGIHDVALAAGKRLSEALRCCEEYGKLIDPTFAACCKQLRYRSYTLEQELVARLPAGARQWRLCILITESLCTHHGWLDVAKACLDAGADCLQLREKSFDAGLLLQRARQLVMLTRRHQADLIVNDRVDLALAAGATGVHLGTSDLPLAEARRLAGHRLRLGASTHNLTEARRAMAAGCDYCGVGAMFPTATKERRPSGLRYLSAYLAKFGDRMPHLAIGGITPDNIGQLVEAGCRGVAVSAVVCGAANPARVVRQLIKKLGQ